MRMFPIIPIWLMLIICIFLIFIVIKYNKKSIIQIIMIILMFIINLRIMIPTEASQILANNLDVLFVVDNTISMNALDYDGNNTRLYGVKKDCKYIIKRLNGARFSVITFNNSSKVVIPYTRDASMAIEAIDILNPPYYLYAKGSSLNTPYDDMITSLESSVNKGDRIRIVFYISDGEITDDSTLESFSEVAKYVDNGAVLGYGTEKGGYMESESSYYDYIMDYSGDYDNDIAVSKMNEDNLKNIAKDINIEYINMSKQSNINNKLKEIQNLINNSIESDDKSTYDDTYYFLIAPLLILFIIEFNNFRRKNI